MNPIPNEDAGLPAYLCTEPGGRVLDTAHDAAVELCDLAGAARADRITEGLRGDPATHQAALNHLVTTGALREHTPPGTDPDQRVFTLG